MATFTVINLDNSGVGSLRNAIFRSNRVESTDIIDFDTSLGGGTIGLTSGELRIRDDLSINGLGADLLSVDAGGNPFRVFNVDDGDFDSNLEVAIKGLKITGGNVSGDTYPSNSGGGIFNYENLTVSNSTISGNTASNGGGGIRTFDSDLTVLSSSISGNTASNGGGIASVYSRLTVSNSTISGNTAEGGGPFSNGGGINNYFSGLTVSNSTISDNTTEGSGGGIYNDGDGLTVSNSTISGNTAERDGSGFYNSDGSDTITVTSSIIAANTDDNDIGGVAPLTSGGNNLIGNGDGAEGFTDGVNGDIVGTAANPIDPQLGPLQDNGGPTQTQALLPGSPAINAGSNPLNLEFDQRGPGFDRVVGTQPDIGAVAVPEPDSTAGLLGLAILGGVLVLKRQRRQKVKVMKAIGDSLETLHDRTSPVKVGLD